MSIKADFTQGFVRNHWYAAAWASEVQERPFARTILGDKIVLFRQPDGTIGALEDRCPHRLAPLSMGECADGGLRCGYHGMVFNAAGDCIGIPGQDIIPPTARTRAFSATERYGLIWVWTGDVEPDPDSLPILKGYGEDGWALMDGGYQHHAGNYRIEIENLMDPAHTTFLHKETIGNRAAKDVPVEVSSYDRGLKAFRWIENVPPSPLDQKSFDFGAGRVDRQIAFHFELPATSFVDIAVIPAGMERSEGNLMRGGIRAFSYKFLTPETERSTHFFWLHLRNYRLNDQEFEATLRANLEKTFAEDQVMVTAIQGEQEATGLRQRTAIAIDRAPIMALRLIDRMIASEKESGETGTECEPVPA
ncbi:aromatic ring-hydroxylating dioxygenase subunit alpha [Sphingomonas oryzagri]|uniref:Aromatic ring-hydroxylating dioxygenase subunit alpha n=1 Tax=Sphingomonas oryzagri TaxID=3042314 RepID=A0ABT6N1X8_9SPHN|nr:aromatic ring-hydroxylating dioxygenase subunit alpha [Sphingomonas oryzagri]MDH7639293.1 aromatic ring-hydroxylating dioxygenase subunit alpha [Sphingomonas oryzagri]